MGCKLTSNITKENCNYSVAGIKALYLYNYDSENTYTVDPATEAITAITLAGSAKAYKIDFVDNTASFSDELAVNGNGGKYRTSSSGSGKRSGSNSFISPISNVVIRLPLALKLFTAINSSASISNASR